MERSEQINELAAALALAQSEIEDAEKSRNNPAFRSSYADLGAVVDACKPALVKNGLSFVQVFEPSEPGTLALTTMLLHKSGQWLSGTCVMPLPKHDPQGYGSCATYARRYGLAAMVGVCPADDDGNAASGRQQGAQQRQEAPARPAGPPRTQQAVQASEKGNAYSYETGARQPAPPQEPADLQLSSPTGAGTLACAWDGCGASLTKGQHDISLRAYGHPLCPAHQKEARERA